MTTEKKDLEEELLKARAEILELEAKSRTHLSGSQFLVLVLIGPLFMAFLSMGILVCWQTLNRPEQIGPHLEKILLAMSLFSGPCIAAASALTGLMSDEVKAKIGRDNKDG
ncbi:hypothetical protein [uncultured Mediterranean phage uvDeep-CGR2-KM18-C74]|nr:hypothetical protein [uncultured Mediterranean phage uvDeep-CGR2-KM18-C74]